MAVLVNDTFVYQVQYFFGGGMKKLFQADAVFGAVFNRFTDIIVRIVI